MPQHTEDNLGKLVSLFTMWAMRVRLGLSSIVVSVFLYQLGRVAYLSPPASIGPVISFAYVLHLGEL